LLQGERLFGHLFERVEVDDQEVDRDYAVLLHHAVIDPSPPEEPSVNPWVERLHPPVHHLGETGVLGHLREGDAGSLQEGPCPAGAQDVKAVPAEERCKVHDPFFVPNGEECPFHRHWYARRGNEPDARPTRRVAGVHPVSQPLSPAGE